MKDGQPAQDHCRRILIIGGGASGVLAAAHLMRNDPHVRISMVEKSHTLGCGIAYSTNNPGHLLNTRVSNMSAFPDEPQHFLHWLQRSGLAPRATLDCFVSRQTYGRYLESVMSGWSNDDRLSCLRQECVSLHEDADGVRAVLQDGTLIHADQAVLATGHAVPQEPGAGLRGGWDFSPPENPGAEVVIIGTGLSMVDHIVSLLGAGHQGRITGLSRRGLLPRAHVAGSPETIPLSEVPLGQPVSQVLHWLRSRIRAGVAGGTPWQHLLDGLRAHVSAIWNSWDLDARRRFLRHGATWWEVHRHRMPPSSAALIAEAEARGQLHIVKGRFNGLSDADGRRVLNVSSRGGDRLLGADHVIDCRGIRRDPETDSVPVVRALIASGQARLDPLRLGLDTTPDARIIDADGRVSDRLWAIGPCARAALWEITAIPDIRLQCARLAQSLGVSNAAALAD